MPWASCWATAGTTTSRAPCGTSSGRRGATAGVLLDLRIEYADGTHEVVKSDLDWRTSGGPLVFNSIYTSEHYDARLEQPGWSSPGFDDSAWGGVMYRGAPSQRVTAQQTVPIRNVTEYRPRSVRKLDERSYLYDFGQNMAGVTKLRLRGEAGTQLRLIHAERLREDGHAPTCRTSTSISVRRTRTTCSRPTW